VKDPFSVGQAWYVRGDLDLKKMNEACKLLFRHTDFTSFSKLHTQTKTNNCKIFEAYWEKDDHQLVFSIKADRFLRNMVRAIVGTMVEIGSGKLSIEDFDDIIAAKDRSRAGYSAPAEGLFLEKVEYDFKA
jgi:tRNA pseudouridine38-40 synthase